MVLQIVIKSSVVTCNAFGTLLLTLTLWSDQKQHIITIPIKFDFNGYVNGKIEMYSLDGRVVFSQEFNAIKQLEASLKDYQDGVYIAQITTNSNTITKKIIKE